MSREYIIICISLVMDGRQECGSKTMACLVVVLFLVALAGEVATGVELKDMGASLTNCGNQMVVCTIPCVFRGTEAVKCLDACGGANLGCMGNCTLGSMPNCTGYMSIRISAP